MIRFALALLGLSAGAANAQGLVAASSGLEMCGQHIEVLAHGADCGAETSPVEGRSTPDAATIELDEAIVPVRAVVQRGYVPIDTGASKTPAMITRSLALPSSAGGVLHGISPFEADLVFVGTLDGSDPSAMFCP